MILQKTRKVNIEKLNASTLLDEDVKKFISNYLIIESEYRYALREMSAKLENLDDYCQAYYSHNPIHHIESRVKTPESIVEKLVRRNLKLDLTTLHDNIYDIAGIRVICNYINDIYQIIGLLTKQKDIKVIMKKDYILNPKDTGYRSLHMIYEIEMYIGKETKNVPVEIQFRTLAMDMWASLEHELRYKSNNQLDDEEKNKLKAYSDDLYHVDLNMQRVYIKATTKEIDEDD